MVRKRIKQGQTSYTIPERGAVQRVNFGAAVSDSDGNGLPDAWEIARLGGVGQDPNADADGDGQSNLREWIAGTDPANASDAFKLSVFRGAGQVEVAFVALQAQGPGYEGRTRYYSLESNTNLTFGLWTGLASLTNLPANQQTVSHRAPGAGTNPPVFYRGTIRLE